MKTERGFTLAEILVVMAIIAIIGIIMVAAFTNTLRGSNKSQLLSVIKQNGQAVLDNMDKIIRSSDNVICIGAAANTLVVVKNGTYTRYRISKMSGDVPGGVPPACQKNGCIVQDGPIKQTTGSPPDERLETDTEFINRVCLLSDPMSSANILTDTHSQTGVAVPSGSFTLSKPPGFKAAVTVAFKLQPGVDALPLVADQIDPVEFQTTIGLR